MTPPNRFLFALMLAATGGTAFSATPISGITTFEGPASTEAFGVANGAGLTATDVFGYDFNVILNSAVPVGLYVGDLAWGTGNGVQYYPADSNAVSMSRFSVRSNGGEDFSLRSLGVSLTTMDGADLTVTVVLTGWRDGFEVATFSRTLSLTSGASQTLEPFDVSAIPGFGAVDEFRIAPGVGSEIGYLGIDDLNAVSFVPEPSVTLCGAGAAGLLLFRRGRKRE